MPPLTSETMLGMANRFLVRATPGDWELGSWSSVTGLEVTWDLPDYRAGDSWNYRWMFPGNTKYPNVKLARAVDTQATDTVKKWLKKNSMEAEVGVVTIVLHDAHGNKVTQWDLVDSFVAKWSVSGFDAGGSKIAVETLEISHAGFLEDDKTLS